MAHETRRFGGRCKNCGRPYHLEVRCEACGAFAPACCVAECRAHRGEMLCLTNGCARFCEACFDGDVFCVGESARAFRAGDMVVHEGCGTWAHRACAGDVFCAVCGEA